MKWCRWRDSNPHARRQLILSQSCMPIPTTTAYRIYLLLCRNFIDSFRDYVHITKVTCFVNSVLLNLEWVPARPRITLVITIRLIDRMTKDKRLSATTLSERWIAAVELSKMPVQAKVLIESFK